MYQTYFTLFLAFKRLKKRKEEKDSHFRRRQRREPPLALTLDDVDQEDAWHFEHGWYVPPSLWHHHGKPPLQAEKLASTLPGKTCSRTTRAYAWLGIKWYTCEWPAGGFAGEGFVDVPLNLFESLCLLYEDEIFSKKQKRIMAHLTNFSSFVFE